MRVLPLTRMYVFAGLSWWLASAQLCWEAAGVCAPWWRGFFYNHFLRSVLPGQVQDTRAQRLYMSHVATPDQLTLHSSAEMFQTNKIFLKWIALEQSFLMKLVLLQAAYFPWHSSRLKSRCKCYQGSDTATSSLLIAKENLQKITHKIFTIWNSNANSHYYGNRRMNQAWEGEATSSVASCTAISRAAAWSWLKKGGAMRLQLIT